MQIPLHSVLNFNSSSTTIDSGLNVMDVQSVQLQLQAHLLAHACSAGKDSMKALFVDFTSGCKNQVVAKLSELANADMKVYAYGEITLEPSKTTLPVAKAIMGERTVEYFMSHTAYDKITSMVPCGVWLMKVVGGGDDPKEGGGRKTKGKAETLATMSAHVDTATVKFAGASGSCFDVSVDYLYLKPRASVIEAATNWAGPETQVAVTRSPFPQEIARGKAAASSSDKKANLATWGGAAVQTSLKEASGQGNDKQLAEMKHERNPLLAQDGDKKNKSTDVSFLLR